MQGPDDPGPTRERQDRPQQKALDRHGLAWLAKRLRRCADAGGPPPGTTAYWLRLAAEVIARLAVEPAPGRCPQKAARASCGLTLSITSAARQVRLPRDVLLNAVRTGQLRAVRDHRGVLRIEPEDLCQFGAPATPSSVPQRDGSVIRLGVMRMTGSPR